MNTLKLILCAGAASLGLVWAGAAAADGTTPAAGAPATPAPMPTPMAAPAMSATLAANPNPAVFDAGPVGKVTVDGVLTGVGFWQSNAQVDFFGANTQDNYWDVSNAQVIINKSDGVLQFFIQAGSY